MYKKNARSFGIDAMCVYAVILIKDFLAFFHVSLVQEICYSYPLLGRTLTPCSRSCQPCIHLTIPYLQIAFSSKL